MSNEKEKIVIDGFVFENADEAAQAKKEVDGIAYIHEKMDMDDPQMVLQIYNKMIEQDLFETSVGYCFLKELQKYLRSIPFVEQEQVLSIPVRHPVTEEAARRKEQTVKEPEVKRNVPDGYRKKFEIMTFITAVLALCIIGMFVIAATSNHTTILNYETRLINKYEYWEQELSKREAAISEKEEELGIGKD